MRNSNGEPDYLISVIEDISERKSLEFSLQKTLKRLSNLRLIDKAILTAKHPQTIAQTAIGEIPKFFTCQRISIVTFDSQRSRATLLATQGIGAKSTEKWVKYLCQLGKI